MLVAPEVVVNAVLHLPCQPFEMMDATNTTSLPIMPGIVGRYGEMTASHPEDNVPTFTEFFLKAYERMHSVQSVEILKDLAESLKVSGADLTHLTPLG